MIDPITLIELTNLKASGKLEELAKHPQLGMKPEWMGELAKSKHWHVRYYLAQNPAIASCPKSVKKLANDHDSWVKQTLAENPSLINHPNGIKKLSEDQDHYVRSALAANGVLAQNPAIAALLLFSRFPLIYTLGIVGQHLANLRQFCYRG